MDTTGSHPHGGKIKSGRKWVLMNARKRKVLVRTAHAKVGVSLCVLARRYGINKFFVEKNDQGGRTGISEEVHGTFGHLQPRGNAEKGDSPTSTRYNARKGEFGRRDG